MSRYRRPWRAPSLILVVAAAAVIVAGCGSSDKKSTTKAAAAPPAAGKNATSGSSAQAEVVKLQADPGGALKFMPTKLSAKAGKVTLEMMNAGNTSHGIAVEGKGVDVDGATVTPGQTSRATADLKAGTYEYYCTVPSHKAAGMKGTLVVK